jgi:hypothetical protein
LQDGCVQLNINKNYADKLIERMNNLIYQNPLYLNGVCKKIKLKESFIEDSTNVKTIEDLNVDVFNYIFSYLGENAIVCQENFDPVGEIEY